MYQPAPATLAGLLAAAPSLQGARTSQAGPRGRGYGPPVPRHEGTRNLSHVGERCHSRRPILRRYQSGFGQVSYPDPYSAAADGLHHRSCGNKGLGRRLVSDGASATELPVVAVSLAGVDDDQYPPQRKVFAMLRHMLEHHIDTYDFFMRADDDAT